jgi:hypothetical protein
MAPEFAYFGSDFPFPRPAVTLFSRGPTIMKRLLSLSIRMALPAFALLGPGVCGAASLDEVVKAFEKNDGYVRPFATLFGSMTNSGWYQSAGVPRGFSFYLGIPINFSQIGDEDRKYDGTWTDQGCVAYHQDQPSGTTACPEKVPYTAPTLFGKGKGPTMQTHVYNPNSHAFTTSIDVPMNDGNEFMSGFNWLPFGEPQLGLSYFHTEAKIRYIALPLDIVSMSLPAFGLQHDFIWAMPNSPVHVSLAANWSFLSAEWTPGDNIDGTLKLDGSSAFYGVLAGWTWKNWLEIFTEIGWETASLKSGGNLVIHDEEKVEPDQIVKPGLTLDGRNGFRMALNVAFHLGYDAVLGQNIGAELGNQVGILAYRFK